MGRGAHRVAHVVQGVEEAYQVELAGVLLRRRRLEPHAVGQPGLGAARRAESMLPAWLSNPANRDSGNASAMISADVPIPHPTSATSAPPRRVSITPSIAGSHSLRIDERYSGPKNRSVEQNRQAL